MASSKPGGGGPPNIQAHVLSEELNQAIFDNAIVPNELSPAPGAHHQHEQPLAVLLVGQTGAGKTRLAPVLLEALAQVGRHPAHFIADTYKAYHPSYASLLRDAPHLASAATGPDARLWLEKACRVAMAGRLDALVESACRHASDFCALAAAFREAGYAVRVAVLAVPAALSRLGVLVRYHARLPEAQSRGLPLRLTPVRVHDDSYAGLLEAARFIDEAGAVDSVVLLRRGDRVAYENERRAAYDAEGRFVPKSGGIGAATTGGDEWLRPGSVAAALEVERRRPLKGEEVAMAEQDLKTLRELSDPAQVSQVDAVEEILRPLLAEPDGPYTDEFPELRPFQALEFITRGIRS